MGDVVRKKNTSRGLQLQRWQTGDQINEKEIARVSVAGSEESPEVIEVSGGVAIWAVLMGRIAGSARVSQVGICAKARAMEIGPSVSNGNVERN